MEEAAYKKLNEEHQQNVDRLAAAGFATHALEVQMPELPATRVLRPEEVTLQTRMNCKAKAGPRWVTLGRAGIVLNCEDSIAASNLQADTARLEAEKKLNDVREARRKLIASAKALRDSGRAVEDWKSEELLMMLRYKKVSNTNQYNSKATRLVAYNAHKDDESEMEDLDPPHDH